MNNKKKVAGIVLAVVLVLAAVVVLGNTFFETPFKSRVLVTRFGRIARVTEEAGLSAKIPFVDNTVEIYCGNRIYDIAASDVITKDKKTMIVDNYVIWVVVDPSKYYQTLGAIAARAEERIDAAVFNATKNTISAMTQEAVIEARGAQLTALITSEANSDISQYGIEISTAEIKALDLPDDNKTAVYERMISERQNIAAGYTAQGNADAQVIRNETDKQVAIKLANANKEAAELIAEGEAEYMRILSEAYNNPEKADFYNYIRGLDALKISMSGADKTLILDKNSELVRILYGE